MAPAIEAHFRGFFIDERLQFIDAEWIFIYKEPLFYLHISAFFSNFVANKAEIVPFVTVKLLEFMVFSKAIQIKLWVNKFNADRKFNGRQPIDFDCVMFSIGHWSVSLSAPDGSIFFSMETEHLCTLVAGGDITFWIGCNTFAPVLYFQ